jgi:hypothetical protein
VTWIPIVVAIVAALGFGFAKEHFRVAGVERWARAKGFNRLLPFTPAAGAPLIALAARLHERGARRWSIGLEGMVDGSPCTIAEYAASKPGRRTAEEWFTLVCWAPRSSSAPSDNPGTWPHEGILVRAGHLSGLRLPGMMTAATLDQVIKLTPEARQRSA